MEVYFTPEQQAQLAQLSTQAGTVPERLVTNVVTRYLNQEARFLAAVEKGITAAEHGEFIEEEEMDARTIPAADDLENIKNYLQQHYPHFAEPTVRTFYQHIRSLKVSPNRVRPGHRSGTRERTLSPLPYVVVYSAKADVIEILHIYHGAQDWQQ